MKNKKIGFLAVLPFLMLAGCGEAAPAADENNKQQDNNQKNEDKEVLDEGNTAVQFEEIENLVMINKKAQDYIDAMKEQEKQSTRPYYFDALDGIDNVNVKNMLNQNDNPKTNRPIHISWTSALNDDTIKLVLCKDWKFNDVVKYDVNDNSCDIDNLLRNTTYYYRLENDDKSIQSQVQKFTTADYTRTINLQKVSNVRDEGGYISSFGNVRTNQEIFYRGSEINDAAFTADGSSHSKNVDDKMLQVQKEVLKIAKELDFRREDVITPNNKAGKSALDTDVTPVEYTRIAFTSYAEFITAPNTRQDNAIVDGFNLLATATKEAPIYFHCWGGADRTGATGFFLNGLLGLSYTDLIIDFELTTQNNSLRSHREATQKYDFPDMLRAIKADPNYSEDKTIAEFCYDWLVANGVAAEKLEQIRKTMIPGYQPGMAQTL